MAAPITVVPSSATTTTGSATAGLVNYNGNSSYNFHLVVTAVSGTTPTLAMSVQWSNDGTNYGPRSPLDTFNGGTNITAAGTYVLSLLNGGGPYVKFNYTIGGTTPSFTWSITAS